MVDTIDSKPIANKRGGSSPLQDSLEIRGLEPLTSALQRQRSTNWAISPNILGYTGFEPVTSPLSGVRSNQLS